MNSLRQIIISLFLIMYLAPPAHAQVSNLIQNGTFETGNLSGWSASSATASQAVSRFGSWSARLTNGKIDQTFATTPGIEYKATAWIKIDSETGTDWGGFVVSITESNGYTYLKRSPLLLQSSTGTNWFQIGLTFKATTSSTHIFPEYWGGSGRQMIVYVDDVKVFVKPANNSSPTAAITANPGSSNTLPQTITFTSNADDVDGAVTHYYWDFGDGSHSNDSQTNHSYRSNGTYSVKLHVTDDSYATTTAQTTINLNDPSSPSLSLLSPPTLPYITSSPTLTITGSAGNTSISQVMWSSDRGIWGLASGTTNWSIPLNLSNSSGLNRILISAVDANGKVASKTIEIDYRPTTPVSIVNGAAGIVVNSSNIELYDIFEATFSLQNSRANNFYFPYENTPLPGIQDSGITINAVFTSPSNHTFTQPGFYYQPYIKNDSNQTVIPSGQGQFKIRFSPTELGLWSYTITVTDASGTSTINQPSVLKFTTIAKTNPNNHGFVNVSETDRRYFSFTDGTPFIGVGPGPGLSGQNPFTTDSSLLMVGDSGTNFARTWMSGSNMIGSSWAPWTGNLPDDGNFPHSSITPQESWANHKFSLTLPSLKDNKTCAFYGHQDRSSPPVFFKPGATYKVMLRVKTTNLSSPGLTFHPNIGWPSNCQSTVNTIGPVTGTKDWHTVTGSFVASQNTGLSYALLTIGTSTGRAYIDEISVKEDLGNGQLGPEMISRGRFDTSDYPNQFASYNWDYGLLQFNQKGYYEKPVIEEKEDYLLNHISPAGFGTIYYVGLQQENTAVHKYQEYYWRYLIARYSAFRSLHSFEYVNEDGVGNLNFTNILAKYIDTHDPLSHMATTSFSCCINNGTDFYWQNPAYPNIDYADTHSYVTTARDDTTWLKGAAFTYGNINNTDYTVMGRDSALYTIAHSIDAYRKNAAGNKPITMGESGVGSNGITAGYNDSDTAGVWLHQYLWPQMNYGGMYFVTYWYMDTAIKNGLYSKEGFFKTYRRFMEGSSQDTVNKRIPLTNGNYGDIAAVVPTGYYVVGQKDTVTGGAHAWMYSSGYTWTTPSGGTSVSGKSISIPNMPVKNYLVDWWNTWTGQVTTQNINHPGGTLSLTVPAAITNKDVAVKIIPQTGYPYTQTGPTPTPFSPPLTGDLNNDGHVDFPDILHLMKNFSNYSIFTFNQVVAHFGE